MSIMRFLLLSAAISAAASIGARAQDSGTGRHLSPEETRQCICMQDRIEELQSGEQPLNALVEEFNRVDDLVTKARPNVNTDDADEVDSFRRMFERREALRLKLQAERHNSELHGLIFRYNGLCAGQRMFKVNVDAVRADPNSCLKEF